MDNTNVVFGRVISGMKVFRMAEFMDKYVQTPKLKLVVKEAGVYTGNPGELKAFAQAAIKKD